MDARTIISELGGYRAVAEALKLEPNRVHNWTRRGIASEFWPDVVRLAGERRNETITFEALKASMVRAKSQRPDLVQSVSA